MGADDPLIGTEVGRFRLTRLLGKGGMGRVYLGVHPSIGSRVAIKVLAEDCADQPDLLERFFTEARAVNLIQHENIVAITDLDRLPTGRPYIVMEYIEGRTVRELVERGPAPLGAIIEMMHDVLIALDAAHRVEIIHRDLKPDNVIVTALGRAKVLDFGIAKLVERSSVRTATGAALGTPHYMAPEQVRGGASHARTDVYAAGVMLFELVTGHRPYEGESDFELMEAHLRAPIPPAGAAPAIEAVIRRALAKDPADRFPSAQAMADALVAAADTVDDALLAKFEPSVLRPKASAPILPAPLTAATKPDGPPGQPPRSAETPTVDGTGPRPPDARDSDERVASARRPASSPMRTSRWMTAALVVVTLVAAVAIGLALSKREVVRVVEAPRVDAGVRVPADAMVVALVPADAALAEPDAAVLGPVDAGTTVAGVRSKGSRSGMPVHTCTSASDCPSINCKCKGGWVSYLMCEPSGTCGRPDKHCPKSCEQYGGWEGPVEAQRPVSTSDCEASYFCKSRGTCKARRGQDTDLNCVTSCADTWWCSNSGLCVDDGTMQCQADADSCARSQECQDTGRCGVENARCVITDDGCASHKGCAARGDCGLSSDGRSCRPRTEADCRASASCKRGGYCSLVGNECAPSDSQACASAPSCAELGYCTARNNLCVVTDASCAASQTCKDTGSCVASPRSNECMRGMPK